jgi:A/G-specific adenine glycosylase
VSEVMSQQTQIDRVVPKFVAFIGEYPSPGACAAAPLSDLLAIWQGLGYPRRCRNLHEAAKLMVRNHDAQVPASLDELLALPGIGDYTARAVLAFAEHVEIGIVDTNVSRVLARLSNTPLRKREAQELADQLVPSGLSWEWNQVVMDFGATWCTARTPQCAQCPVAHVCKWRNHGGPDPAPASSAASKPQARFAGSNRQARGKLMKALIAGGVSRNNAASVMGVIEQPQRVSEIVDSLITDRLIVDMDGVLYIAS